MIDDNWQTDYGSIVQGPARLQIDVPIDRLPWFRKTGTK